MRLLVQVMKLLNAANRHEHETLLYWRDGAWTVNTKSDS